MPLNLEHAFARALLTATSCTLLAKSLTMGTTMFYIQSKVLGIHTQLVPANRLHTISKYSSGIPIT